jgi:hypothetical protein
MVKWSEEQKVWNYPQNWLKTKRETTKLMIKQEPMEQMSQKLRKKKLLR